MKVHLTRCWALFLSIFVASISMADGKYFGPRAQIREPDMPRQRALITYKGGVETLVVESVVEGEASEMAWVVPVPSEPKEVGSATPGTVGTLPFLLRPDVLQVYPLWLPMFGVIAIVLLLYSYWRVGCKRVTAGWFIAEYLMMFIVCAGTVIVFFPVFAQAKGSSDAGFSNWREVERMEVAVVGSHEVKSVAGWLTANGFSISEDEARVIDDYENDGWRFVVSRVKSGGGLASPKPLRVVFETDRAVYPMALTGAGLDRIHVDLCVVGDAAAHTRGFTAYETAVWDNEEPLTKHPEIAKYVWDGAFVTRLVADVSGSALHRDAYIEFGGGVGKGKVVARNAIAGKTLEVIMASLLFFMIVVGAVVRGKGWSRARFAMYGVGGPLLIGALYGLWMTLTVPLVDVTTDRPTHPLSEAKQLREVAAMWSQDVGNELKYAAMAKKYARQFEGAWGKDVPGGVVREGDQIVSYDHKGNPLAFEIVSSAAE